jgi:hypothetical protein
VALPANPTNGNLVVGMESNGTTLAAATFTDSNSVAYTQESNSGVTSAFMALWDNVVAGSPTKTYTLSVASNACVYELSSVSAGTFQTASSASNPGTTITATIPGVTIGSPLICGVRDTAGGATAITTNNGTLTADIASGFNRWGHVLATATASTTCTATVSATDNVVLTFAYYPSSGGGGATRIAPWIGASLPPPDWLALCPVGA